MKARYQIVISLSEEDNKRLQAMRAEGYQIVEVFRFGLEQAEKQIKKNRFFAAGDSPGARKGDP